MNMPTQTYKNFDIYASAQPVTGGFIPKAFVRRLAGLDRDFDVRPPSVAFSTEEGAVNDAIAWSKDLVDVLEEDFNRGKLH